MGLENGLEALNCHDIVLKRWISITTSDRNYQQSTHCGRHFNSKLTRTQDLIHIISTWSIPPVENTDLSSWRQKVVQLYTSISLCPLTCTMRQRQNTFEKKIQTESWWRSSHSNRNIIKIRTHTTMLWRHNASWSRKFITERKITS